MKKYQHDISKLDELRKNLITDCKLNSLLVDYRTTDLLNEKAFLLNLRQLLANLLTENPELSSHLRQVTFELGDTEIVSKFYYKLQWNFNANKIKEHLLGSK